MKFCAVILLICIATTAQAGKVREVLIRNIGAQPQGHVAAVAPNTQGSVSNVRVIVKDAHHAAKDCSVAWYEADVDCIGAVQFKGIADCSKPTVAEQVLVSEDCGTQKVKSTKVKFSSGHSVEIKKVKPGVVVVNYND